MSKDLLSKEEKNTLKEKQNKEKLTDTEKVPVQKPTFPSLEDEAQETRPQRNLDLIMDVPLEFSVVLGKSKKTIKEILSFGNGSVVELEKLADEPLEIYVNGKLIAHGEVVVINENFGVRITNILSKEQRVKNL
jgi:flagellar motor switch protein FliN/FliY